MKTYTRLTIAAAALVLTGSLAFGQSKSTFFLDNFSYNYRHNAALMPERSFFSLGVGNIDLFAGSNVGLSSFLYPSEDGQSLVTGLNKSVSSDTFLSGLNDVSSILANTEVNLLSIGSRKEKSFTNIELNTRVFSNLGISSDLFRLLKNGTAEKCDLSSTELNADAFLELAIGHSKYRDDKKFGFGYRIKALLGIGSAQVFFDETQISSTGEHLNVNLNARGRVACPYLNFVTDKEGKITGFEENKDGYGLAGYGAALDLGFLWRPADGLTFTAGVADLGAINWEYKLLAQGKGSVKFDGLDLSADNSDAGDELEDLGEQFEKLANFGVKNGTESEFRMLPYRLNAGVRYRMPFIKCLSVGAYSTYQNAAVPFWDARLGATLSPFGWLSLSGNYGYSSLGDVCGVAVSFTLLFLNAFVALDGYRGPVGEYVEVENAIYPVNKFNYRVSCGLVMQLGKRHPRR